MTIRAGTRLGPYEILSLLGAGGMGEVYRARDSRLGRAVAIKVLPDEVSKDREKLARFEQEARAVSALCDPHIVSVFDIGRESEVPFLVTELVEGSDLRALLEAGRFTAERTIELAAQIADGLAAAHEKGIVHRDLKPENILVTVSNLAKIADFGLAKAVGRSGEASRDDAPTVSSYTLPGTLLGTVGYMSPEQVRGQAVDHRSDIFSLGSMLHEMLTGSRPFQRETAAETMTAILTEEAPERSDLHGRTGLALDRIVHRCLEKRPEQRFQSARDLAFFLRTLVSLPEQPAREAAARNVTRSVVPLPRGTRLSGQASPVLAISRDASKLAFVAQGEDGPQHLYVSHLDRGETEQIPESECAEGPFFSPDGRWVAFAADVSADSPRSGELRVHSFSSGLTQMVCPLPGFEGGCWGEDGAIYFVGNVLDGLRRIPSTGGREEPVVTRLRAGEVEGPRCIGYPRLSAGGRSALVLDWDASALGDTSLLDLSSGQLRAFASTGSTGAALRTGHVLYTKTDGTLFAAPFDPSRGCATGPAVAILKDIALDGAGGVFAVSDTGTLVFARGQLRGSPYEIKRLVRLGSDGTPKPLALPSDAFATPPCFSPNGRFLAIVSRLSGLWICDLLRGTRARLPLGATRLARFPVWSPDGEWVVFRGALLGEMGYKIFRQRSDGSGPPEVLCGDDLLEKRPRGFTPDGETLLYEVTRGEDERGLWGMATRGSAAARRQIPGSVEEACLSPDGRFLAYQSGEFGSIEVFAQRLVGGARRVQVSLEGGRSPRWSHDGRQIFYLSGDRIFAVACDGERMEAGCGPPEPLFERPGIEGYDVAQDGSGFVTVERLPDSGVVRQLELVTSWFVDLERLVPAPGGGSVR